MKNRITSTAALPHGSGPRALAPVIAALALVGCGSNPGSEPSGGGGDAITCPDGRALVGSGTAESPFEIACREQLAMIRVGSDLRFIEAHYVLVSDLDFSGVPPAASIVPEFGGVFDGGSHVIRSLSLKGATEVGFFGRIDGGAQIKALVIDGASIQGEEYVGSLVGLVKGGSSILNVSSVGATVMGENYVGGLIGSVQEEPGPIEGCKAEGVSVRGSVYVGGLVGAIETACVAGVVKSSTSDGEVFGAAGVGGLIGFSSCPIVDSSSDAAVTGEVTPTKANPLSVGGLVGTHFNLTERSHATGRVSNPEGASTGGLVGYLRGSIVDSYAQGPIEGGGVHAGGLVGTAYRDVTTPASILRSYATGSVEGTTILGGLVGNIETLSEEEDKTAVGFVITQSYARGSVTGSSPGGPNDGRIVGGLVGSIRGGARIEESYAIGAVSGSGEAGGLVGRMEYGEIVRSFSASPVGGAAPVGGIVGEAAEGAGALEGCFWDIDRSGVNQCIGESPQPPASCVGVNPDGSAPGLFFSASSPPLDLWDFMNVWLEQPADYPTFK